MTKDLTTQDFLDCGYTKFSSPIGWNSSDFGLQKKFKDDIGLMYYVTVWAYKNKSHLEDGRPEVSFSPDIQFNRDGTFKPTINIEILVNRGTTVQEIEEDVYGLWLNNECDYYEIY